LLFPWLPGPGGIDLALPQPPGARVPDKTRGLVALAEENDFWLVSRGQFQRWNLGWTERAGRKLVPSRHWPRPVPLGSPLHAAQVIEGPAAGSHSVFVVTDEAARRAALATMLDRETGEIRWQRQLGLECRGQPLLLESKDSDKPGVVL